jgi:hypothetical protein
LRKIITWGEGSLQSSVDTVEIPTTHRYRIACRNDIEKKGEGEKDAGEEEDEPPPIFFPTPFFFLASGDSKASGRPWAEILEG